MSSGKKRVCIIGAGPCGMSALYHFVKEASDDVEVVCFEKQNTWGGLWNFSWRTGTDEFGEPSHAGMYKHLWSNGPKECLEFPDYTFEQHFGKALPSFPPRAVIHDYVQGRWKSSPKDLRLYIRFNMVVRNVQYIDAFDNFTVTVNNLVTNSAHVETFTHVIVAVGIFNTPNVPSFPGIETFQGRNLHSHNFRDAIEFKNQRLLIVGASFSAEDIALQCLKYGAKNVVCCWRTQPMGLNWPDGIEERPLLQKIDKNTVYFKDGSSAEFDSIILCTGYIYSFPFMGGRLRLKSAVSLYPDHLYKGTLWVGDGNNRVFYMGIQDQYYTFTMFDAHALWACKYILGKLPNEPKSRAEMEDHIKKWVARCNTLKTEEEEIDFQTDFVHDLIKDTGYPSDAIKVKELFYVWEQHRHENIVTYRDKAFTSVYTNTRSPDVSTPWWNAFDDTIETFTAA